MHNPGLIAFELKKVEFGLHFSISLGFKSNVVKLS